MPRAPEPSDLAAGLASLARLQQEHRPILAQVLADAGMQASTRSVLVEHLLEEEHERVGQLLALSGKPQPAPAASASTAQPSAGAAKREPPHGVLVPAPAQSSAPRTPSSAPLGSPMAGYSVGSLRRAEPLQAPQRGIGLQQRSADPQQRSGAQQLGSLRPR
jgi:hypothetical protein